jgi:uncharacterized linocin/CFP29 family protein
VTEVAHHLPEPQSAINLPQTHHAIFQVYGVKAGPPAVVGAFVLSTRGGDFALHIGHDVSIGYTSHPAGA